MSKKTQPKSKVNTQPQLDLPPQIPGTTEELQRLILLLGNRTKSDLTSKTKRELIALIGAYPTSEKAAAWKQNLKPLVKMKQAESESSPQIVKIISQNGANQTSEETAASKDNLKPAVKMEQAESKSSPQIVKIISQN